MRIVFIINGLGMGGAEMMLVKVLERLDRQRFTPCVISLIAPGELASRITPLDIPVQTVNMKGGLTDLRAFVQLVHLIKEFQPDAVHTWLYHADLLGGLAARLAGVKALGWNIRNSNLDADKTKLSTRLIARLCALVSHKVPTLILSCSEQARLIHIARGYAADKMVVVPNGFDLTRFKPDSDARKSVRAELGLPNDALLVGLIGRFDPQKNHIGFFVAAELLRRQMPEVHFLLAGKGVDIENPVLTQAANASAVLSNCHFLGLRNDIPRLMAALDVLASSSHGEAFPNVLGEAMACGVPCAVTNAGDSAYIVADTGRIVSIGDMPGLASALGAILTLPTNEKTALGEQARIRVATYFEIANVVRQYESFYEQLKAKTTT